MIAKIVLAVLFPLGILFGYSVGHRESTTEQVAQQLQAQEAPYPELHAPAIADLVNVERAKAGLPALAYNAQLEASACAKAEDMITQNYWNHIAPDGSNWSKFVDATGYQYYKAGENLAYGQRSNDMAVTDWMNSTTHKANIVDQYTDQGMCVRYGAFQGGKYAVIVNHFGMPL